MVWRVRKGQSIGYSRHWHSKTRTHSCQDESEEICVITTPYAVVYPLTVMVASIDTIIALRRSVSPHWVCQIETVHTTLQ